MVADLLERRDRRQDRALLVVGFPARPWSLIEGVEHGLVEADLFGGHGAVVELVDPVGQFGGDRRFGLGPTEHEDAVEGAECALGPATGAGAGRRQL